MPEPDAPIGLIVKGSGGCCFCRRVRRQATGSRSVEEELFREQQQTARLEKAQQSHASAWAPLLLLQSALANVVTVFIIIWLFSFLLFSPLKGKWLRRRRRGSESWSFIAWSRRQPSKPSTTQSSSVMTECCKVY